MNRMIGVPESLEIPTQLGGVVDATIHRPVDRRIRDFIQRTGFLRPPENPSPLTDMEIQALSGDPGAEPDMSFLIDADTASSRLENSSYIQNEETEEWGYWSSFGTPGGMRSELVFPDLMPLLEINEHRIPRFLGSLLGAQYYALGLTVEAVPDRDPGFLHYWTVVGTDAETGEVRIDLLSRDNYKEYMGEPYPVSEQPVRP